MIVTLPGVPGVTTPVLLTTEAIVELLLLHVPPRVELLRVAEEPPPEHKLVTPDIAGFGIPVTLTIVVLVPHVVLYDIVVVPVVLDTPVVRNPVFTLIDATAGLLLDHVPPGVPSLSVVVTPPAHNEVRPVIAVGNGVTVSKTVAVAAHGAPW